MLRLTLHAGALRCLADTFLTNSSSHFLPRLNENKLRFQIDAFRFYREPDNQVAAGAVLLCFLCIPGSNGGDCDLSPRSLSPAT